ncbi:unnamed protein product, partial [Ectocarpus fasciculatus]
MTSLLPKTRTGSTSGRANNEIIFVALESVGGEGAAVQAQRQRGKKRAVWQPIGDVITTTVVRFSTVAGRASLSLFSLALLMRSQANTTTILLTSPPPPVR